MSLKMVMMPSMRMVQRFRITPEMQMSSRILRLTRKQLGDSIESRCVGDSVLEMTSPNLVAQSFADCRVHRPEFDDGRDWHTSDSSGLPVLRIAPWARHEKERRAHIDAARMFIGAVQLRRRLLFRVTAAIFDVQTAFLDQGESQLVPLTLYELADVVGVHESSICRALARSEVDTPWGVYPLKFFVNSASVRDVEDNRVSRAAVQRLIEHLVTGELATAPYTDAQLCERLREEHGLRLSRRTVTQYRNALGIPPSVHRQGR